MKVNREYETAEVYERKVRLLMELYGGDELAAKEAIQRGERYGRKFSRSHDVTPITVDEFAVAILLRMLVGDVETAAWYVSCEPDKVAAAMNARVAQLPDNIRVEGERAWQRVLNLSARHGGRV